MRVLALDVSASTGWARWRPGLNRPDYGTKKFGGALAQRAAEFESWVIERIVADELTEIAAEAPFLMGEFSNIHHTKWLLGANVILHKVCYQHGIQFKEVAIVSWRAHFIGITRAPKGMTSYNKRSKYLKKLAVDRCQGLGWDVTDHNQADALGVLDYYRARHDPRYGIATTPLFGKRA